MTTLILTLSLINAKPATQTAQVQPCAWPKVCSSQPAVAQVQPCVWPRVCASQPAQPVQQIRPCSWPNVCAESKPALLASGPVTTCQYPNVCAA